MNIFDDQALFMQAAEQTPNVDLYWNLVQEEISELQNALIADDEIETADGIMDSIYVLAGLANSLWGPEKSAALWAEVQRSNMSKVQAIENMDGSVSYVVHRRADGKIQKPATYSKPDLASVLHGR
jgi:hypothetical protein